MSTWVWSVARSLERSGPPRVRCRLRCDGRRTNPTIVFTSSIWSPPGEWSSRLCVWLNPPQRSNSNTLNELFSTQILLCIMCLRENKDLNNIMYVFIYDSMLPAISLPVFYNHLDLTTSGPKSSLYFLFIQRTTNIQHNLSKTDKLRVTTHVKN